MQHIKIVLTWTMLFAFICAGPVYSQESGETAAEEAVDPAAPPPIPPPLPPKIQDEQLEPTVFITTTEEDEVIEQYSFNGRVYMVRVTPAHGTPYYYIDMDGDGQLELQKQDDTMQPVKPVMWKIKEW